MSTDLALLVFRVAIAAVMLAHGWHHAFGRGGIAGTAGWFERLGMRPGRLHAWLASLTEIAAGVMLAAGAFTPLAGAAVIGVMVVALVVNHRRNGFFIFRPGEGWEYVIVLAACGLLIGSVGPGRWSVDAGLGLKGLPGGTDLAVCLTAGLGGGLLQLALFWRPNRRELTQANLNQ